MSAEKHATYAAQIALRFNLNITIPPRYYSIVRLEKDVKFPSS